MKDASSSGMALNMHRATLVLLIVSCIGGVLLGCATPSSVPEGSRKLGVYTGTFDDDPWTVIRISLWQTPEGAKTLDGRLVTGLEDNHRNQRVLIGSTFEDEFRYEISGDDGIISGRLSEDGNRISGDYLLNSTGLTGTWQAERQ